MAPRSGTAMASSRVVTEEERRLNVKKDGGRRLVYGGDPYEDDVEPADPTDAITVRDAAHD